MIATARDVARLAGVSVSTVSRALGSPHRVAPQTRRRVVEAADVLRYTPHLVPRVAVPGRTDRIGLVVADLTNPHFAAVAKGVQRRAHGGGFTVAVEDLGGGAAPGVEVTRALAQRVDGVVMCCPSTPARAIQDLSADCTLVLVNKRCGDIPSVTADYYEGVRQALTYMVGLGHRRIGCAGGPMTSSFNIEWHGAFERFTAGRMDLEIVDLGAYPPGTSGGAAAADLAVARGVTAVFAYTDLLATGVVERLQRRGIDVPGQMSVIGSGDLPIASTTSPPLTTIRMPLVDSGRAGVDLLMDLIRNPSTLPEHHWNLEVHLVVRDSTGPVSRPAGLV